MAWKKEFSGVLGEHGVPCEPELAHAPVLFITPGYKIRSIRDPRRCEDKLPDAGQHGTVWSVGTAKSE